MNKQALHNDNGKSAVTSIPPGFILEMGEVFQTMKKDYPDLENGQPNYTAGYSILSYLGSAMRHLLKFAIGKDIDSGTGKTHLACCACNIAILWWMWTHKPLFDDRIKS